MTTQQDGKTVAIIGSGFVGTSDAYGVMLRRAARRVRLYDIDARRVEAEVLDLAHSTPLTAVTDVDGGADLRHVEDADVVVFTAGTKMKPGQTRLDLAATNVGIMREVLPELVKRAPEAHYIFVTNPCDILATIGQKVTGLPPERVLSSGTVLDTSRLRRAIADRTSVNVSDVHAYVVGEHGDTGFPLWSSAVIGTTSLEAWGGAGADQFRTESQRAVLTEEIRSTAYAVAQGKGTTNYSVGIAVTRIIEALLHDEQAILPVSTVMDGFLDVEGVALSVPSVVSKAGAVPIPSPTFSEEELKQLYISKDALRGVLGSLGF